MGSPKLGNKSFKKKSYTKADHEPSQFSRKPLVVSESLQLYLGAASSPVSGSEIDDSVQLDNDLQAHEVPRKPRLTTHLGELEYRILSYVIANNLRVVSPSDLALELGVDSRRVWDALQRLAKRGVVVKRGRGSYEINRGVAHVLIQLYEHRSRPSSPKETDSPKAVRATANTIPNAAAHAKAKSRLSSRLDKDECDTVKIHVRVASGDGILFVHRVMEYAYYLIQFARNYLRQYLHYLGFSKTAIKRCVSIALRRIDQFMRDIVVDGPGLHGLKHYLVDGEDITVNLGSKELGINIRSNSGEIEKFFIKIYSIKSSRDPRRTLLDYAKYAGKGAIG